MKPEISSLLLKRIEISCASEIPSQIIKNMTVEEIINFDTGAVRHYFRSYVLGRSVRQEVVASVIIYDSWWENLKASHFPRWFTNRFPPKYKNEPVKVDHWHVCPHLEVPKERRDDFIHIHFLEGEEPSSCADLPEYGITQ